MHAERAEKIGVAARNAYSYFIFYGKNDGIFSQSHGCNNFHLVWHEKL